MNKLDHLHDIIKMLYCDVQMSGQMVFKELREKGLITCGPNAVYDFIKQKGWTRSGSKAMAIAISERRRTYPARACRACNQLFEPIAPRTYVCNTCAPTLEARRRAYVFGLTQQQYDALVERQQGGCGICHRSLADFKSNMIHVDHCHYTGVIRGILCHRCNSMLGGLEDREWRPQAERYLNESASSLVPMQEATSLRRPVPEQTPGEASHH